MTVLVTKPAVNIREELADLKDQTTYDTVKSAGALMDVELTNEAAVKGIDQALTTTSSVEFTQVTGALVGNASTATTLETARDITLSGDVTGSASFDGSGNIDITATVADDSHNHTIANVDGLQTALDAKQPYSSDLTAIAGLSSVDGNVIVGSASGWVAESGATAVSAAGAVMDSDFTTNGFMKRTGDGTYTVDTNTYLTEVTANDVNSGAAADGYVLTANGVGGAAWEVAASGGVSDGSTLTTGFTFNDNAIAKFGTGGTDLQLKSDGSNIQATLGTGINFYLNAPTSGFFYAVKEGSGNNDVPVPARILNSYSLAATNGGGVGLDFASPNGNGIVKSAATFYARYNDVTNGAEDTRVEVHGYTAGSSGALATIRGDAASTFPSGITTTSDGDSSQWATAYGWGNHASAGYADYSDTTANFTGDLQVNGTSVATTGKAIAMAIVFGG